MSELLERTLGNFRKVLGAVLVYQDLKAVTLCLLMYPSGEAHQIIEAVLNG